MAVLNELGRNSAAITYGALTTGADIWPTFATVDKWLRNDTLQGTMVTGTGTTVTGTGTVFVTQLRINDIVLIGGQKRVVASITSDSSFEVTVAFSPAVTYSSSARVLAPAIGVAPAGTQLAGTVSNVDVNYGNFTAGTVYVSTGSQDLYGVGTYFRSELTNDVTTATVTNSSATAASVSVASNGTLTGTSTLFQSGSATQILQPGDSIIVGTSDCFIISAVSSDTVATVRVAPSGTISGTIVKANNSVIGRTISVNGRVRTIISIVDNNRVTVNAPWDFTDSNLTYKVFPRGTVSVTANSNVITGTNTNFKWDMPNGSQVWIGDELRTFTWAGSGTAQFTGATATDPTGFSGMVAGQFPVTLSGLSFKRDDSYLTYTPNVTLLSDELRVGDDIVIDGADLTVTQIISDTQFRVNNDLWQISGRTVYKKKKLHGFVLEGIREGQASATQSKYAGVGSTSFVATSVSLIGTNVITVNTAATGAIDAAGTTFRVGNFIKVQNGGGAPVLLTGTVYVASNTVTGTGTAFTSQLHVGAEICIGGNYAYVASITNANLMTITPWQGTITVGTNIAQLPLYRTTALHTYITNVTGNNVTLYHTLKNTVAPNSTFGPGVLSPSAIATDYIEYVYSAPNKSAEASISLFNKSYDRKYFGFRYFPMATTGVFTSSNCAYNLVVYERWVASWAQSGGVGLNKADYSDGSTALNGVTDKTNMYQQTGGFLYLFAKPRYFVIQGKSYTNIQQQWLGCIEFERAQPEDVGTGLGTATPTGGPVGNGYTYYGAYSAPGYQITPQASPFPCFAYFNSNRFPVGSTQIPTAPVDFSTAAYGVHGGIFSVPRIKGSSGDLVGLNAHIYTAATITTGRWGHLFEMGACGAYTTVTVGSNQLTTAANTFLQPHLGNLVPVNTNVYNSKRFMFSPVMLLGPTWDPDIRGRMFGLKIIPSALGTLMDTVSVTIESTNDFYDAGGTATDHWVITAPNVNTFRISLNGTTIPSTSVYRSLEDTTTPTAASVSFTNNFRFAIPT